jgi:glycosyltransferase involved in cell wall biosynthesis
MDRRFGLGSKLHVITNGYDPKELADVKPHNFGHFAIVYAGNFYPPKRVISPIMAALKRLLKEEREWHFHYYGGHENHICEEAKRFEVMERVVLHGNVPRVEALSAVRGAGITVVITSVAEDIALEDQGIVPGKVFEALGLGTPILMVAPPGSDIEIIGKTIGLAQRCVGNDIDGIVSVLKNTMLGNVAVLKDPEDYAWTNIAQQLDSVLRTVIKPHYV